jgi:hypothetical protein
MDEPKPQEKKIKKSSTFGEFWRYMRVRKKLWLLPIILVLVLLAFIMIAVQSSALSPLIYALF